MKAIWRIAKATFHEALRRRFLNGILVFAILIIGSSWAFTYLQPGAELKLLARPEALGFAAPDAEGALRGAVTDRRFAGSVYVYTVSVEGGELEIQAGADPVQTGDVVGVVPLAPPAGLFAFAMQREVQDG